MSWERRSNVSLQLQRMKNLGHKDDKWLISSILPGRLGREAQKSVECKSSKVLFSSKRSSWTSFHGYTSNGIVLRFLLPLSDDQTECQES